MLYQSEKTGHVIDIWNSRDGVTPFIVSVDGEKYVHIAFSFDRCVPLFRPKPGMYIWRTCTQGDAEGAADKIVSQRPELADSRAAIIANFRPGEGPWLEKVGG